MARDGFDGLGKMRGGERNSSYIPKPHGETKPHESTEEQEKSEAAAIRFTASMTTAMGRSTQSILTAPAKSILTIFICLRTLATR